MLLYLLLWFKKECDIWTCIWNSNGKPFARKAAHQIFNSNSGKDKVNVNDW